MTGRTETTECTRTNAAHGGRCSLRAHRVVKDRSHEEALSFLEIDALIPSTRPRYTLSLSSKESWRFAESNGTKKNRLEKLISSHTVKCESNTSKQIRRHLLHTNVIRQ